MEKSQKKQLESFEEPLNYRVKLTHFYIIPMHYICTMYLNSRLLSRDTWSQLASFHLVRLPVTRVSTQFSSRRPFGSPLCQALYLRTALHYRCRLSSRLPVCIEQLPCVDVPPDVLLRLVCEAAPVEQGGPGLAGLSPSATSCNTPSRLQINQI